MSENVRPAPDVLAAHLHDETVLLHMGSKRYFHLNDSGQRVWQLLESGVQPSALATRLHEEFDIDAHTANAAVADLLTSLRTLGLIEDVDQP